jgi:hypothetical protein
MRAPYDYTAVDPTTRRPPPRVRMVLGTRQEEPPEATAQPENPDNAETIEIQEAEPEMTRNQTDTPTPTEPPIAPEPTPGTPTGEPTMIPVQEPPTEPSDHTPTHRIITEAFQEMARAGTSSGHRDLVLPPVQYFAMRPAPPETKKKKKDKKSMVEKGLDAMPTFKQTFRVPKPVQRFQAGFNSLIQ